MPVISYDEFHPKIGSDTFVAPDAWIIGKVEVGNNVAILFSAVLRGDVQKIFVGDGTNIQDHALVHSSYDSPDAIIGKNVTVGHRSIIHGATVEDSCIIGMGATILDGAVVGKNTIVGAHALVTKNMEIPANSLVMGMPAKVIRPVNESEIKEIAESAIRYQKTCRDYLKIFTK